MVNEEHRAGSDHDGAPAAGEDPAAQPMFHVVAGHPTHEEIAALAAALTVKQAAAAAAAAREAAAAPRPRSAWADRRRLVREPLMAGPNGWRCSALPR